MLVLLREQSLPEGSFLVTSDLVDYFERIDIPKLLLALEYEVAEVFSPTVANFVMKVSAFVLRTKFFRVNGTLLKKCSSLSIGEQIATSAANVFRHHHTKVVLASHAQFLRLFKGYVDDVFFIWVGPLL